MLPTHPPRPPQCDPVTLSPPRFPAAAHAGEGREERWRTDPEAVEVGVGGIVGLVVSFHQGGNNSGLLLVQTWPHGLAGRLLLLPLHYHVLLPLDLLVRQDDCGENDRGENYLFFLLKAFQRDAIKSSYFLVQKQTGRTTG